jgi:hypothetical protein
MTRDASHSTSDIVTVFARQGIAISTIARAMAIPTERVTGMCERAKAGGELQMLPPAMPNDPRHALLAELTNLRAQLDDARAEIREFKNQKNDVGEFFSGVAKMTPSEAKVVGAIARYGRASKSTLYHALYGGLGDDEQREPKIVDVMVCKLRKKLRQHNIEIETIWGVGYTMDPESVARLRELAGQTTFATIDAPKLVPEALAVA